ncbi:MAG: hypothetical protein AB7V43_20135 [Acidimicrobiia bacterium]
MTEQLPPPPPPTPASPLPMGTPSPLGTPLPLGTPGADALSGTLPPPPPPSPAPGFGPAQSSPESYVVSTERPRRRRTGRIAVGAFAALAIGGAGAFAVVSASSDSDGGAKSPEAAVQMLFDAAGRSDLLGVMDALEPAERRTFSEPMQDAVTELKRLGIVAEGFKLNAVPGLTMTFTNVDYVVESVGQGVSTVMPTAGKVRVEGDWSKAPLGNFLINELLDGDRPEGTVDETSDIVEDGDDPARITTVQRDGRWYVSLWYSVAEAARLDAGLDAPDFGNGIAPAGADTPEGAVEQMIGAISDLDLERMIALMPPDEMAVLYDYAPLFLDDAQDAAAGMRESLDISVSGLQMKVTGSGSRRHVGVEAGKVTMKPTDDSGDGEVTMELGGGCVTMSMPTGDSGQTDTQKMCPEDANEQLEEAGLGALANAGLTDDAGFTVVQVDGKWYLSPMGTITDVMLAGMRAMDQDMLTKMKETFSDMASGDLGGVLSPLGSLGGEIEGIASGDSSSSGVFGSAEMSEDDLATDEMDSEEYDDPYGAIFDKCSARSVDDYGKCLLDAAEAGDLPIEYVPMDARFPACFGDYYEKSFDMDDATFIAETTKVADCLKPFIESGELDPDTVDPVLTKPECLTGNLYGANGDDFDKLWREFSDCAYATK